MQASRYIPTLTRDLNEPIGRILRWADQILAMSSLMSVRVLKFYKEQRGEQKVDGYD
jgi:hypothetical protein